MIYDALSEAFDPSARLPREHPTNNSHSNTKNEQPKETKTVYETIYTKDDEEIQELYNLIKSGQTLEKQFEGGMIKNFDDLLRQEQSGKDTKMS